MAAETGGLQLDLKIERPGLGGKKKKKRGGGEDGLVFPLAFAVASRLELTCEVRQQPEWSGIGFTGRTGASLNTLLQKHQDRQQSR